MAKNDLAQQEPGKSDAARQEEGTLAFWKEQQIFERSLGKDAPNGEFVFYDGPPFATGLPHSGSLLSSVCKDLIPRYKTMRGYRVRRRWGWDTHGLPIESLVEKKLGLKNKKEILSLGIEKFNEEARSMVLEYVHDWKRYVERVGRWVDFDNSYKTMDASYTESVWWALKQIHDKGRLYEGRKVLMYCPHCETPLAKAEIAMDNTYKDVTEEAVTVKFESVDEPGTYFLAWTTTPWTLPGNVGLAVGPKVEYIKAKTESGVYILAKDLAEQVLKDTQFEILETVKGSELVGKAYKPLYPYTKESLPESEQDKLQKAYHVYAADFVTTTDGTGIVHTAVIYGEDDFQLGSREGLPMVQLLNPNGTYNDIAPEFIRGQYIKKAEPLIKEDLEQRGLLFAKKAHTHAYPHCYRCGTALIYNAVSSWFIDVQSIKEKMLAENEHINWIPEHLKHGRFEHILETAPDWTISRNRFWASPLPIWKDAQGKVTVIGSLEELQQHIPKSGNTYFAMRHGTTQRNVDRVLSSVRDANIPLIEEGKEEVRASAEELRDKNITRIYTSPYLRTKQSAELVAEVIGLSADNIIVDERLGELNFGDLNDGPIEELFEWREAHAYDEKLPGGESSQDAKNRFGAFLYDLDATLKNEHVLVVTHGIGFEAMDAVIEGCTQEESKKYIIRVDGSIEAIGRGKWKQLDFKPLPHNRNYELDYHLPYIDEVQLVNENGEPLTRIPEVVDCWVESGAMPFAEYHYPFENKEEFEKRSPGDFVSEYIGQTRAWFYYMHAMGVEMFDRLAFKNVITTGNLLAADGEKVSKSKQNYTDPYVLFDRFSADAFRYYLMSSVLMQAEDLSFRDDELKEAQNRVVNMLRNVLAFYNLFKDEERRASGAAPSTHILDRWILSRLAEVTHTATNAFDQYEVSRAVRPMRDFIDDLSTWYVRRSRDRVKAEDSEDKQQALEALHVVLHTFAKVVAPVMPFIAEEIFQATKYDTDPVSVHLCEWPVAAAVDEILHADMARARAIASEALMMRQKSGIKVRQPLGKLSIPGELSPELCTLIGEELNVKEIVTGAAEMTLDTELTPGLVREGDVREFVRALSDARKAAGLAPKDQVSLTVSNNAQGTLESAQLAGVSNITFTELTEAKYTAELSFGSVQFTF